MLAVETPRRPPVAAAALVGAALLVMTAGVISGRGLRLIAPGALALVTGTIVLPRVLSWRAQLSTIVVIILFIPMKYYGLPASLPIRLEPYRLMVAIVLVVWLTSTLIDRRVRLRRTHVVDLPLAAFLVAIVVSEAMNSARFSSVETDAVKGLLFFASIIAVFFMVLSLVRTFADVDFIVRVLTGCGAVVAFFALIEAHTGYNVFHHLSRILPFLRVTGGGAEITRGGRLRVYGSAEHPIALSALFAMLVPFAFYRAICFRQARWWAAVVLLLLATFATQSRTGIVMLLVDFLVYVWLRGPEVKRLWPLVIPVLLVTHIALPGTLGSFKASFFPQNGIVAQQTDQAVGSGRIATFWPAIHKEFTPHPIFGEGFATRITTPDDTVPVPNAPILDDQWLGSLLETGIVGALALGWLFIRFVRKLGKKAKHDRSPRGWVLAACAAAVAAYAESMFTYDSFGFTQETFVLFLIIALGCVVYRLPPSATATDSATLESAR
jgi:polysaccharide biosynthesis protein PslJ